MEGDKGFLACLERRLAKCGHAVIVVSEGAGQDLLESTGATDASGNKKLSDIGVFLKDKIEKYYKAKNIEINLKYIDPSYKVRASVTTAADSIYCERLGNNAVHAVMAGKTKCIIDLVHDKFLHLPIKAVTAAMLLILRAHSGVILWMQPVSQSLWLMTLKRLRSRKKENKLSASR